MKRSLMLLAIATLALGPAAQAAEAGRRVPTVDDLLNLRSAGGALLSPDGRRVAYTITSTDFKQDASVTHIWLADATAAGTGFQLTQGEKS